MVNENDKLSAPPPEIVKQGNEAVVNWAKQIVKHGETELYEAKILFVGEPGAGKTSLKKKLMQPDCTLSSEEDSTIGVEVEFGWSFPVNDSKYFNANLWDFGGQDIQFMFHQFFLTSGGLYLLLTDNRKQNTHFNYWFNIIRLLGAESKVIVVKNEHKGQKITNFDEYSYRKFFPDIDFSCFDVDLANSADGRINALIEKVKNTLLQLKHIGNKIPSVWPAVRKEIISIKNKNYINWETYQNICIKHKITSEEDQTYLLRYLHITGLVLYYQDDDLLSDIIFINPNWVFEAVYSVLKQDKIINNGGLFKKRWIEKDWTKYSKTEKAKLFRLLLRDKFDVCYPLDADDNKYIVPLLLPPERKHPTWGNENRIQYRLEYEFLPYGLLARLIVRLNEFVDDEIIWKNGALFSVKEAKALVTFNETTKRFIEIEVGGIPDDRKFLLETILLGIRKIHERSYPNIIFEEKIQCNCSECMSNPDAHLYNVRTLTNWLAKNIDDARCEKSGENIPIQTILDVVFSKQQIDERIQMKENIIGKPDSKSETYHGGTHIHFDLDQENSTGSNQSVSVSDLLNRPKITPQPKPEIKPTKKWFQQLWFIISSGVAVTSGIIALVSKVFPNLFDLFVKWLWF